MICFPLDNTEYEAKALGAWCGTRTRGVFSGDDHFRITANGDMSITVGPGLAWLKADVYWGVCLLEPEPTVIPVDTADGALPRYDAIYLRYDKNLNKPSLSIKKGSTTPQPASIPAIFRNLDYDEIYIGVLHVRAGTTSILDTDIEELHLNEAYCGIMRDGVTGIPTQQLYDRWNAWMQAFTDEAQQRYSSYSDKVVELHDQYSSGIAVHEQNAQQVYNAYEFFMTGYRSDAIAEARDLLDSIRDTLSDDAAGNLYNLIEGLAAQASRIEATIFHDITGSSHLTLFDTLNGYSASGYWNEAMKRIEC